MAFEFVTLHGTFTNYSPSKHQCRLPHGVDDWPPHDPENRPTHWTCNECGQVYAIEYTGWTGWWSPDTEMEATRGPGEYGTPTIFCRWETWGDCYPSVTFVPRKPNNLGVSGIGMVDPFPGKRPDRLPPLPQNRRRYVSEQTRPRNESRKYQQDVVIPPAATDTPDDKKKRRPWLLRG